MKYPDDYINKIIQGDCLEVMKGIPDKSVDLVLTDPPYGVTANEKDVVVELDELLHLKRNFIGIEISEKYCEIARRRLEQEQLF